SGGADRIALFAGRLGAPVVPLGDDDLLALAEDQLVRGVPQVELPLGWLGVVAVVLELGGAAGLEECAESGGGDRRLVCVVRLCGQPVDDRRRFDLNGGGHCWSLSAQVSQRPSRVKGPAVSPQRVQPSGPVPVGLPLA